MNFHEINEMATLGGGCFWCLEAIYDDVQGVKKVVSGYSGGEKINPSYEAVCSGTTGHAEVIQITFDPSQISFREILEIFFTIHDPTTLNRQGNDVGTQYRSAIFYHSVNQKETAEQVIKELEASKVWNSPIVTELTAFMAFYPAEEYHQKYFKKNPGNPYCRAIINPKIAKFRKTFTNMFKLRTQYSKT